MSLGQNRIPSGIPGLDQLLGGGFSRNSLILVAGNPGTGKTIFASQFLYYGVKHGEPGVYVSFAEDSETFKRNMHDLGLNFERLEKEGKFKFLDMITTKRAGVSAIFETILDEINSIKAKRLVIDSFTVLAQALREKIASRVILHNILGKIVKQMGCSTLMVIEVPVGVEQIGLGIEEFVADCIIELFYEPKRIYPRRKILIHKMRGAEHDPYIHDFIIKSGKGIEILPLHRPPLEKFEKAVSTGAPQIDELLGGGVPYGSFYLFEIDPNIDKLVFEANYLRSAVKSKDVYVQIINSALSPSDILRSVEKAGFKEQFDESVRKKELILFDPFDRPLNEELRKYIHPIVGYSAERVLHSLEDMFNRFWSDGMRVRLESDLSDMVIVFGEEAFLHIFPRLVALIKEYEGVWLGIISPDAVDRVVLEKVRSTADGITRVWNEGSYNFIQVIKSRNKLYSKPLRYIETNQVPFIKIME